MKRNFLALLVVGMTFILSTVESLSDVLLIDTNAADYIEDTYNGLNYKMYSDHIAIAPSKVTSKVLNIPSEIAGLPVTVIEPRAFQDNSDIVSINFPDSIVKVGELAFYNCDGIETFVSPKNVTYISGQLLDQCDNLKEVIFSDNVTSIDGDSIENCKSIERIVLPLSLEEFKFNREHFTNNCPNLKEIIIDDRNRSFSTQDGVLFDKLKKTLIKYPGGKEDTSYTVPNSIISIDSRAFYSTKLVSVEIPEGVKSIGSSAFSFSRFLTDVSLPSSISEISDWAFSWTKISFIDIPKSIVSIGSYSFAYSKLQEVEIPNSVSQIGENAFYDTNLSKITINNLNCFIYDKSSTIHSKACIYGYSNSSAQEYADKYGRQFVPLSNSIEQAQGGSYRFSLSSLGLKPGDILNINVSGDAGDTIQVHFYYNDKDGNVSSSLVGGLGGTVLDSNGKKTVSFTAPNDLNSISVNIVYNKSLPTYTYDIKHKGIVTQPTTITTITTKPTTTTTTIRTTTTVPSGKNNEIKINQDNYSFLNDNAGFNTKYNLSSYFNDLLSSKACNTEWDAILNRITGNIKWSGSCYGMSSVQVLAKAGLLNVKTIDSSASCLYDWKSPKNNAEVESIINYFHMMQYSKVFTSKANKFTQMTNKKKIDSLINMCLQVKTGENPVVVCFNFSKSPSTRLDGGHAVVAYGVEYGTWSYSDTYNCRILISDPNVSGFKNENCIYINTDTYKWEIPYYQAKYYSCTNNDQNTNQKPYAQIRFATNDLAVLDVYGYLRNTNPTIETYIESTISINNNTSDFGVTFYDEKSTGSFEDSPCDLVFFSGLLDANATSKEVSAILPQADTPYEYYEKGYEAFDTTIDYTNSRLKANVSNGSYAIYQPEKSVEFAGQNSDYELSMTMNEGYYPTDWYNIKVQGVNSDKAKIVKTNNGYIISGDSLSEGIMIEASNRTVKAKLGVMLNYDSALIYEVNENTIGIKIDSNNDGVYETKFNPDYIGDINIDGQVSIADAVVLQKYLLNDQKINRQNYIAGDINMDGSVDVFDMVLMRKLLIKK